MHVVLMNDQEVAQMQALVRWAKNPNIATDKYDQGFEAARQVVCQIFGIEQNEPVKDNGLVHG